MKNFLPEFAPAAEDAAQDRLIPKLGGLPWGFPLAKWPRCKECGHPMALIAQLPDDAAACPLGDPARVLHLFMCIVGSDGTCSTWEHESGANTGFILTRDELGAGLTSPPAEIDAHPEFWIKSWTEFSDAATDDMKAAFVNTQAFRLLPPEIKYPGDFGAQRLTKTGGVPYWTGNGPMGFPRPPYEYLMQIDTFIDLPKEESADFANFGSDGVAYVFIDRTAVPPNVLWFWNR